MKFKKHIFVCTNTRTDGRKSCGETCGMELVSILKEKLVESKLHTQIRVQKAGCLDVCNHGPALVIYPQGLFYGKLNKENILDVFEKSILKEEKIEDLIIPGT